MHKMDCVNQKKYTIRWIWKNKRNINNKKCTKNISKKQKIVENDKKVTL